MEKLKLGIDHMFQYLEILRADENSARESGNVKKLNAVLLRIDSIKIMLDTALFNTVEERAPELKVNMDMFDMDALQKVLPGLNVKALPQVLEIDFSEASSPEDANTNIQVEISKLLETNFVKKVQDAVSLYISKSGKNMMPADAWIEIKNMLSSHRLIPRWDQHIANTYEEKGPLAAYAQIKKNLPNWSDNEISRVMEDAIRRTIVNPNVGFTQAKILEDLISIPMKRESIKMWSESDIAKEVVSKYVRPNAPIGAIKSESARIIAMMDPHKREKMEKGLGRRAYVEK